MVIQGISWCISFLLLLQMIQFSTSFSLPTNETDRLSLLAFKAYITDDPFNIMSSWNVSLHFCEWPGVTCSRRTWRVTELDLRSSSLVGSLAPHVGNLSFLTKLDVANNSFGDDIPHELGRLVWLQYLNLENNTFSGEIPLNISHCFDLLKLGFGTNNLTGKLPAELGLLRKLQQISFHYNNLVGEIPHSLGNLSSLERLSGTENNFYGGIPYSFGNFKRLTYLALESANLSGSIPSSIYNLSSLMVFAVGRNRLTGSLPSDLGCSLPQLQIFNFNQNQFTGHIPSTISNASNLILFSISNNNFAGTVPILTGLQGLKFLDVSINDLGDGKDDSLNFLDALTNKSSLQTLFLMKNRFGGLLSRTIGNFTNLRVLRLGSNEIRGRIPTEIGNLFHLQILDFNRNKLTGVIPSSIGRLKNLRLLSLRRNNLSGNIPISLGNLTSLITLSLSENNLQGTIPSRIGNCHQLLSLFLYQNKLSGPIPTEVFTLSSLATFLDLSGNQLTGSLPPEVSNLANLGHFDMSKNKLFGEIPATLGSCISLERLYLEENLFQGTITQSMQSLRAIQSLNISHNNLTGKIPKFIADLKLLESLDLSFNDFDGEVPTQGVFQNVSAFKILGNTKLCGGMPQLNLPRCVFVESTNSKSSTGQSLIIAVTCSCVVVVLITLFFLFCYSRKSKVMVSPNSPQQFAFRRLSYEDLLKATNKFSSQNLIGSGSFASVYKGVLHPDERIVAVKVLNLNRTGAFKSFIIECEAAATVRHRNLVKVLTACSSINFEGNAFKAIVYEFMVNGTLEEWLHTMRGKLDLIQRLNIAIDVASAFEYLHHHSQVPVIHCDLKPSNVLLDADMTAHVGDFGLASLIHETSARSLHQTSSVCIKGTVGYVAPEYASGSDVSMQGDAYSFGILLLEMFTGKRPTDAVFTDGLNLHNFVKLALPNRVEKVLDPNLLNEDEGTTTYVGYGINNLGNHRTMKYSSSILNVGVACSMDLPRERMVMSAAAAKLLQIKDMLLTKRTNRQHIVRKEDEVEDLG